MALVGQPGWGSVTAVGVLLSMVEEHQKAVAATLRNAQDLLTESTLDAVLLLRRVVNDERAYNSDRLKAANMILDRTLGKPRERLSIEIEPEPPWAVALREMYAAQGPLNVGPAVIDADVIEDEDPIFEND